MKILRITSEIYPYSRVGGLGIHSNDLTKGQALAGNQITVCACLANFPEGFINTDFPNYSLYNIGRKFVIAENVFCFNLIPYLLKHIKEYDVVHAHSHLFISTFCCALVRKIVKYPLIITNHGLISQTVPSWLQKLYNKTVGKFIFRSADCVITYTTIERDILINWGVKAEKIKVIHNGIEISRFQKKLSVVNKKKQIIWVGRYIPGKGYIDILNGFAKFSAKYQNYQLLMIGTGPEIEQAKSLIKKLGIDNKTTINEAIPNEEMQKKYQESEIFVSAALAEGVPKTMLEAMLCGLPIISTNLPHLLDIVANCGLVVPINDSDAIAHALEILASDETLRNKFSINGHQKVIREYNWENMVKGTLSIYEKLKQN